MIMLNIFLQIRLVEYNSDTYQWLQYNNNLKQKTNTVIHADFPLPSQIVTNRLGNAASAEM